MSHCDFRERQGGLKISVVPEAVAYRRYTSRCPTGELAASAVEEWVLNVIGWHIEIERHTPARWIDGDEQRRMRVCEVRCDIRRNGHCVLIAISSPGEALDEGIAVATIFPIARDSIQNLRLHAGSGGLRGPRP